jgi:hypothetical protein
LGRNNKYFDEKITPATRKEPETMTSQEKKNFREVEKAFRQIQYALSSLSWGQYGQNYFKLNLQEARQWDKARPSDCRRGLSVTEEAKLFFVKWLVDYIDGKQKAPTIKDVLHLKPSAVMGATLCANFPEEIKKALRGEAIPGTAEEIRLDIIEALDYAELVKSDEEKELVNV